MTLFQYFQEKGQTLPSIQERRTMFGLGQDYIGTAEQNTALLAKLQAQPAPGIAPTTLGGLPQPQTPQFPNLAPTAPNQAVLDIKKRIDETLGQIKEKQAELEKAKAYEAGLGKTGGEIPSAILTPAITPEQAKREGRITELEGSAFTPPSKTWQQTYDDAYKSSGLEATKTELNDINTKIVQAKDDLIKAEAGITENPWLTETGRVGRIRTLTEMANKTISNLNDQYNQKWDLYKTGLSQAENVATRTQAETEAGRKLKADELDYLVKLRKEKPTEPKTFGNEKTGYYTWEIDPATGKFAQKQVIAPIKEKGTPQLKQDKNGEWVWIYPDGTTSKSGMIGKIAEFGEPTTQDKADAKAWIYRQPGMTEEDVKKLETDKEFFYWVLQQAG